MRSRSASASSGLHPPPKGYTGAVFFGGILNQDAGGALPIDARPGLAALGVRCVGRAEELAPALAGLAATPAS